MMRSGQRPQYWKRLREFKGQDLLTPPEKITTKKPNKRKKASKDQPTTEDSMYLLTNRVGTLKGVLESTCPCFFPNLTLD